MKNPIPAGTYQIDPAHSRIGFVARHAVVTKVRGSFDEFSGSGTVGENGPESLSVSIQAASLSTRQAQRDEHVRGADFLDVTSWPTISFTSKEITESENGWSVTGGLTIKDVTRDVTIDLEYTGSATDPFGNERVGLEGRSEIDRRDWGVSWNAALEAGGLLVSTTIGLEFEISAIRDAA